MRDIRFKASFSYEAGRVSFGPITVSQTELLNKGVVARRKMRGGELCSSLLVPQMEMQGTNLMGN